MYNIILILEHVNFRCMLIGAQTNGREFLMSGPHGCQTETHLTEL